MEIARAAIQLWARRDVPPESQDSDEIIKEVDRLCLLLRTITGRITILNKELETRCSSG